MLKKGGLSPEIADYMIENCIGMIPLPLGLGLGFKVNGRNYIIPMAIEEPSVIAACSAIGKLISEKGSGFKC
jgi:hydroxymethylglutaryl-CoA reductase